MDRVTSMRVFSRAAAAGSLSGAARQLGMSPAMATKHVNALEARLGVKLFHRSTRRLTP
ncbi:MAG: LysR family transcriptional regulator, partial [Alcaligenaceae bacterium]|nr:LysR family transcriptional regulator [Alcaligenaceae bacterium]